LRLVTNDPLRPLVAVPVSADAEPPEPCRYRTVPNRLLLGTVSSGPGAGAPIVIENLGTLPGEVCELRDIALSAASAPVLSLDGAPIAPRLLHPGESLTLTVKLGRSQGPDPVAFQGELRFTMVNAPEPQGSVPISGTFAQGDCLIAAPDDFDFGTLAATCSSSPRTISLYNVCSRPVTVTSFGLSGAGPPGPEFHLVAASPIPAGGLIMAPGAAPAFVTLRYAPLDIGSDSAALLINAIEPGGAVTRMVSLWGKGGPVPEHEDVFYIPVPPKVDLLVVVDDSLSMADQQAAMASNFAELIRRGLRAVDLHVGVITADDRPGAGQGRLIGDTSNPKVLTPSTPNVEAAFLAKVNVGAASSAPAAGLSTALKALSAPLASTDNAGFLRPDAILSVLIVSDGRDSSPLPVADYLAALGALKPSGHFLFSVVGPFHSTPPAGCTYDTLADDGRYAQAAAGHGETIEICDSVWWGGTLIEPSTPRTSFFLNGSPYGGIVTVLIDGIVVPASAYQYDQLLNAVVFPASAPPPPGSMLKIRYRSACS
ncbi:MAG: vWA domain-containing protein, partial [Myxococcaceae bacterium]